MLYVGAHRHDLPGGFFKSTDGGLTWRESAQLENEAIHSLAQSESDPDTLIAGTFNGIFRSDNAGETWKQLPTAGVNGLHHVESLAIDPRTNDTIYAGTLYLPYKSLDGGQTWKIIHEGMIDDSDVFAIDIDPRDPNHVIMLRVQRHLRKQERRRELAQGAGHSIAVATHARDTSASVSRRPDSRRHHGRLLAIR